MLLGIQCNLNKPSHISLYIDGKSKKRNGPDFSYFYIRLRESVVAMFKYLYNRRGVYSLDQTKTFFIAIIQPIRKQKQ